LWSTSPLKYRQTSGRTFRIRDEVPIIEVPVYTHVETPEHFIHSVMELEDGSLLMALAKYGGSSVSLIDTLKGITVDGGLLEVISLEEEKKDPFHTAQLLGNDIVAFISYSDPLYRAMYIHPVDGQIHLFRLTDRCWGSIEGNAGDIIRLKCDSNLLVTLGHREIALWSLPDLSRTAELSLAYEIQSSICELEDGRLAFTLIGGQLLLVSVQSMYSMQVVQRLSLADPSDVFCLIPSIIEIKTNLLVFQHNSDIRVWDLSHQAVFHEFKHRACSVLVKAWAEGMYLISGDDDCSIKGRDERGECWLHISVGYHHSWNSTKVLRDNRLAVICNFHNLNIYKITDNRR